MVRQIVENMAGRVPVQPILRKVKPPRVLCGAGVADAQRGQHGSYGGVYLAVGVGKAAHGGLRVMLQRPAIFQHLLCGQRQRGGGHTGVAHAVGGNLMPGVQRRIFAQGDAVFALLARVQVERRLDAAAVQQRHQAAILHAPVVKAQGQCLKPSVGQNGVNQFHTSATVFPAGIS